MNIDNFKKICVVGWGQSGVSLCNLLLSLKKDVKVSELKERDCFPSSLIDNFRKKGVKFEFGGHSRNFIKNSQLLILSPGVDSTHSPVFKSAHILGVPCVGEIEFSFWLTKAKFVAITGTNGKTTTAYLIHKVLKERRKRIFLGGNIGIPLSSFVLDTRRGDIVILEVSSFQLETILEFKPYLAAFLNIEPDHLDRYRDFKDYLQAKINIFKNQDKEDWALLNRNIYFRGDIEKKIKSRITYFSTEFTDENFSCVYKIARVFGLSKVDCLNIFSSFKGLSHRLQFVKRKKGVVFINDSKATNPSSTIWALKNIKTPVILLAGGKDKGLDYSSLLPCLRRVRKINLFGEASRKISESLNSTAKAKTFFSLKDAVTASFKEAESGDTILFSPMCASFDMFSDYRERGDKFMEIVNNL